MGSATARKPSWEQQLVPGTPPRRPPHRRVHARRRRRKPRVEEEPITVEV
jgi:hypothetical protein